MFVEPRLCADFLRRVPFFGLFPAALLTLLSMTLFAGNSVLCRLALLEYKMEPVTYTAVRLISGALMLWLIMAVRHKNVFKSGTWPGALSLFTYMACFSWAYVELPTAVGTLIIAVAVQTRWSV